MPDRQSNLKITRKDRPAKTKNQRGEKTTIKALGFLGVGGGVPCTVDYRDGKVIRIRPLHYDWKYDRNELNPWKFEVRGKVPLLWLLSY